MSYFSGAERCGPSSGVGQVLGEHRALDDGADGGGIGADAAVAAAALQDAAKGGVHLCPDGEGLRGLFGGASAQREHQRSAAGDDAFQAPVQ
jgi:hypothetical protein